MYSSDQGSLDAYSLETNARVGNSLYVPDGHKVLQLMGDLALLSNETGGPPYAPSPPTSPARSLSRAATASSSPP